MMKIILKINTLKNKIKIIIKTCLLSKTFNLKILFLTFFIIKILNLKKKNKNRYEKHNTNEPS